MKHLLLLALIMGLVACDRTGPLDAKDPKAIYLESNLPHLKVVRDQLAFEYVTCKHNIERLRVIAGSFNHEASRYRIRVKVESMEALKDQLKEHLDKIDAEAEQGIALKEINNVDGGGLRHANVSRLMSQSTNCLKNAKAANSSVVRIYNNSEDETPPPKVVRVSKETKHN